jgi:hypothetical protein
LADNTDFGIVFDMAGKREEEAAAFWNHVRQAFKHYLDVSRRAGRTNADIVTQADLARALGLSPQRFANFLAATSSEAINGFALASACALGMTFEFSTHRIGRLDSVTAKATDQPFSPERLILEFSDNFEIEHENHPLTVKLRRHPPMAEQSDQVTLRFKKIVA